MRRLCSAALLLCITTLLAAQSPTPQEARATRAFNAAKSAGPLPLHAFLTNMPKGADLHMHLSGAIYAESLIAQGATDHLCVNQATLSFFKPQATTRSVPPQPICGEGNLPAAAQTGQSLKIMQTPTSPAAAKPGYQSGWPEAPTGAHRDAPPAELAHLRDQLLGAPEFRANLTDARKELDDALTGRDKLEHC